MFMINIANIFNWTPLLLVNGIFNYIRSAIILLLPPKYEIIMVPSNRSIFQYCDIVMVHGRTKSDFLFDCVNHKYDNL